MQMHSGLFSFGRTLMSMSEDKGEIVHRAINRKQQAAFISAGLDFSRFNNQLVVYFCNMGGKIQLS